MNPAIVLFEPPPAHRVGGLDVAIRSLEAYLRRQGLHVEVHSGWNAPPPRGGAVAHFHGLWRPELAWASAACRRRGIPYVVSPHGMLEPWAWDQKRWKKRPWYHLVERPHLRGASALVSTSTMERANVGRLLPAARHEVIPLAIAEARKPDYRAARSRLGWRDDERVLLFLSRIHPKKGLHMLLAALAQRRERARCRLVIVGSGDEAYSGQLREFIRDNAPRLPQVDWLGPAWDDSKWTYFQGADVFCLPSHSENFGIAVLEALQVGTPVMVSDRMPWAHLEAWNAAIIVEPTVDSIALGLERYLSSPPVTDVQRQAISSRAHGEYGWDSLGPAYVRLYRDVLDRHRA